LRQVPPCLTFVVRPFRTRMDVFGILLVFGVPIVATVPIAGEIGVGSQMSNNGFAGRELYH
jgi:hypothetical protein